MKVGEVCIVLCGTYVSADASLQDFLATTIRSNKTYSDYSMGAWAANNVRGIRNYVYSLVRNENIPNGYCN